MTAKKTAKKTTAKKLTISKSAKNNSKAGALAVKGLPSAKAGATRACW